MQGVIQAMPSKIAGGRVLRAYRSGGSFLPRGTVLTTEQIMEIPLINRKALVEKGWIEVFAAQHHAAPQASQVAGERHVVNLGFGKYDVIEGVKLNPEPLDADQVHALTGVAVGKVRKEEKAA